MIVNDPSRMYAALRCVESELAKEKPSIAAIRAIVLEAGRELRPTKLALDGRKRGAKSKSVSGKGGSKAARQ